MSSLELISVKVAVRCRPLVEKEIAEGCRAKVEFHPAYQQVALPDFDKAFTFDHLFPPSSTQDEVYSTCVPSLLDALFKGYNATVLAYGQTGSGKTYTMGTAYSCEGHSTNPAGIIPKAIEELFQRLKNNPNIYSTITVSFLEVYNEDIYDLFSPTREGVAVREDNNGIKVAGLKEVMVSSLKDVFEQLSIGSANRKTGSTNMNKVSSRSHALFTITMKLSSGQNTTTSKFHLVDLAGSEKAKKTGAQGDRFKEGVNINRGLFALGNVISALCDKSSHVPYRDSRLTRLLQDSLGGNSHTIMIACISPADSNLEETLNTLRYADRARKIKNKPIVNLAEEEKELSELKRKYEILENAWTVHLEKCPLKNSSSTPASSVPSNSSPASSVPSNSSPASSTPSNSPLASSVSSNSTPAGLVSSNSTPAGSVSSNSTPAGLVSSNSTPAGLVPSNSTPASSVLPNSTGPAGSGLSDSSRPAVSGLFDSSGPTESVIPNSKPGSSTPFNSLPEISSKSRTVQKRDPAPSSDITNTDGKNSEANTRKCEASVELSKHNTKNSQLTKEKLTVKPNLNETFQVSMEAENSIDFEKEIERLLEANQELMINWADSHNASKVYGLKVEQMEVALKDWKQRFEDLTSEIMKIENTSSETGTTNFPKEILDSIQNFSEAIAFYEESEPQVKLPVQQVTETPHELVAIQNDLKTVEEKLREKQQELMKNKAHCEDLEPLKKVAEEQQHQIEKLEQEKSELEMYLKQNRSARISEDRRKKISDLEKQVALLRKQLGVNQKALKSKESVEQRVKTLNNEIMTLKKSRVAMQKRHEQAQKLVREEKLKAAQQAAQANKKLNQMIFTNQKLELRKNVLEQKLKEAGLSKKRLETILTERQARANAKSVKSKAALKGLPEIHEFLEAEMDFTIRSEDLHQHVEELKYERASLAAEESKLKKEIESVKEAANLADMDKPQEKVKFDSKLKELTDSLQFVQESLDTRSEQLTKLQKQTILFDQDEQKKNWKKFFSSPEEMEVSLFYLFQRAVDACRSASKANEEKKTLSEQLNDCQKKVTDVQQKNQELISEFENERLQQRKQNEDRISVLEKEHRSKVLEYLQDISSISMYSLQEAPNLKIVDQIQKQAKEISTLNDIQEELKKKSEECDVLQKEIQKISKRNQSQSRKTFFSDCTLLPIVTKHEKKSKPVYEESLHEEDEMSFEDDKNDPDWRRTPFQKPKRTSRLLTANKTTLILDDSRSGASSDSDQGALPKKSLKRSTSVERCKCGNGACKTNRCPCKKRDVICTSQCKCSSEKCFNYKSTKPGNSNLNTTFLEESPSLPLTGIENLQKSNSEVKNEVTRPESTLDEPAVKTRKLYDTKKRPNLFQDV